MKRIAFESVPEMIKRAIFMAQSGYTMEEIEKFVDTLIFLDMLDKPTTHGKSANGKNYERWKAMKKRCFNPRDRYFHRYGGRGISIYQEWIDDFDAFDKYVSSLPHHNEPGYTIDRIDNDGNYEPGNLRWATAREQAENRQK